MTLLDPPALTKTVGDLRYARANVREIDVKNSKYGAKGDGTTNDYPAIYAAYQDAVATGGTVKFPPGTYYLNDSGHPGIQIAAQHGGWVTFKGSGRFATTIKLSSNTPCFLLTNTEGDYRWLAVEDLTIDKNNLNSTIYGQQGPLISQTKGNIDGYEFRRVDIINAKTTVSTASGLVDTRCIDITLNYSAKGGAAAHYAKNILVEDCYFGRSGGGGNYGIALQGYQSGGYSVGQLLTSQDGTVNCPVFFDNIVVRNFTWDSGAKATVGGSSSGIILGAHGYVGRALLDNVQLYNAADDCLELDNCRDVTVENCKFGDCVFESVLIINNCHFPGWEEQIIRFKKTEFVTTNRNLQIVVACEAPIGDILVDDCVFYSNTVLPKPLFIEANFRSITVSNCKFIASTLTASVGSSEIVAPLIELHQEGGRGSVTVKDCVIEHDYIVGTNGSGGGAGTVAAVAHVGWSSDLDLKIDNVKVSGKFQLTSAKQSRIKPLMFVLRPSLTQALGSGFPGVPDAGVQTDLVAGTAGTLVLGSGVSTTSEQRWVWYEHYDNSYHNAVGPYTDHAHAWQFQPGATLNGFKGGILLKWVDANNYIDCYVTDDGTSSYLKVDKVVAGSRTNLATSSALGTRISNGTKFWVRGYIQGSAIKATYITTAGAPTLTTTGTDVTATLGSGDVSTVGPAVQGRAGITFVAQDVAAAVTGYIALATHCIRADIRNIHVAQAVGVTTGYGVDWVLTSASTRLRQFTIQDNDWSRLQYATTSADFNGLTDAAHLAVVKRKNNRLISTPVPSAVTVPASGVAYTNADGYMLQLSWSGGVLTSPYVEVSDSAGAAWQQIHFSTGPGSWILEPGSQIRWNYSSVPSVSKAPVGLDGAGVPGRVGNQGSTGPIGISGDNLYRMPAGALAETWHRNELSPSNVSPTSGQAIAAAIDLAAGTVINSIAFLSNSAASGPTNYWFFLADSSYNLLAVTADGLTAAWAATTLKTLNLASAYTVPSSGLYYIGVMYKGTSANLISVGGNAVVNGIAPIIAWTDAAHTGLSTPGTAPAVFTPTAAAAVIYGYVS